MCKEGVHWPPELGGREMQPLVAQDRGSLTAQVRGSRQGLDWAPRETPWLLRQKFTASTHGARSLFAVGKFSKPTQTEGLFFPCSLGGL